MPRRRQTGLLPPLLLGLLFGHGTSRLPPSAEEELATDLEAPGVLAGAALRLATAHNEVVFVVTGPDATSMQMANNSLVTLAGVGLRGHTMMMADSFATCQKMGGVTTPNPNPCATSAIGAHPNPKPSRSRDQVMRRQCYWSSRVLKNRPSESIVNTKFWDWRFRFYYVKKLYNARLVELGFAVLQADTDTVCTRNESPTGNSYCVEADCS